MNISLYKTRHVETRIRYTVWRTVKGFLCGRKRETKTGVITVRGVDWTDTRHHVKIRKAIEAHNEGWLVCAYNKIDA